MPLEGLRSVKTSAKFGITYVTDSLLQNMATWVVIIDHVPNVLYFSLDRSFSLPIFLRVAKNC